MSHREIKKPKRSAKSDRIDYPIKDSRPTIADKPAFSFLYLQDSHCISRCSDDAKLSFVEKMRLLSELTWNEIRSSHKHGLGSEKIDRDSFYVKIPSFVAEDDALLAIRFFGRAPMVGMRRGQIFHILWFDENFDVYNHGS